MATPADTSPPMTSLRRLAFQGACEATAAGVAASGPSTRSSSSTPSSFCMLPPATSRYPKDTRRIRRVPSATTNLCKENLAPAGRTGRQRIQPAHFLIFDDPSVMQEVLGEARRVGAPEDFALDDEAWHAEDAARRGFLGIRPKKVLNLRMLGGVDAKTRAERGEAGWIASVLARGPDKVEDSANRIRGAARGERKAQVLQRVERMQGRKAQWDSQLLRFPDAGAVGPFPLGGDFRRPLLAPMVQQSRKQNWLINNISGNLI